MKHAIFIKSTYCQKGIHIWKHKIEEANENPMWCTKAIKITIEICNNMTTLPCLVNMPFDLKPHHNIIEVIFA